MISFFSFPLSLFSKHAEGGNILEVGIYYLQEGERKKGIRKYVLRGWRGKRKVMLFTASKFDGLTDKCDSSITTLEMVVRSWNDSFAFKWLIPEQFALASISANIGRLSWYHTLRNPQTVQKCFTEWNIVCKGTVCLSVCRSPQPTKWNISRRSIEEICFAGKKGGRKVWV